MERCSVLFAPGECAGGELGGAVCVLPFAVGDGEVGVGVVVVAPEAVGGEDVVEECEHGVGEG